MVQKDSQNFHKRHDVELERHLDDSQKRLMRVKSHIISSQVQKAICVRSPFAIALD